MIKELQKKKKTFEEFIKGNKQVLGVIGVGILVLLVGLSLSDPIGVIPPSIDEACCDDYCRSYSPYYECESYTQQSFVCTVPNNVTSKIPALDGATPIQLFHIYNISAMCDG